MQQLSDYMYDRCGKKVLILLDAYDTPMQEAYLHGYWDQMSDFVRSLFNSTFKTNTPMERAVLTGITRISKESVFSDFNNPAVITTTVPMYETAFGFTQEEVFAALQEYDLYDQREKVKEWYDGFTFGRRSDIYNPWSITNYLKWRRFAAYWANPGSSQLVSGLIRKGSPAVKMAMEKLLQGECIRTPVEEEIVFTNIGRGTRGIWSLLLAAGYLRVVSSFDEEGDFPSVPEYTLKLTNGEVRLMFSQMVLDWFAPAEESGDAFIRAMIRGDADAMNVYMNEIALATFSSFDTGKQPSAGSPPERFCHGFVLGLLVRERDRYLIRSNRESGSGRYDICMYPKKAALPGIIMEFKVRDRKAGEKTLQTTASNALKQIREKHDAADLREAGIREIRCYGFAFSGKKVLIRKEEEKQDIS